MVASAGVGTALAVSIVVAQIAGPAIVRVPVLSGPSYAEDVTGFAPVRRNLIGELPGRASAASREPSRNVVPVAAVRPQTPPDATPSGGTPAPAPSDAPQPAAPRPRLEISLAIDHTNVHPNDTIVYTVGVANTGAAPARDVVVESHVPDGTTLAGWECDGDRIAAEGRDGFVCGDGARSSSHAVSFAFGELPAGGRITMSFWVKVDKQVGHNTAIVQHAHVYANEADLKDSEEVVAVV